MSSKKVIIVGAGIYGLISAKTYLQINPNINLTIIDSDSHVGGVWSASCVYPGLTVDSPSPCFEFSELKIKDEFGIEDWSDLTGEVMSQYLHRYAQKFNLLKHCRLNTKVTKIEREGKGWKVRIQPSGGIVVDNDEAISCDVLILASGSFSLPNIPNLDTSSFPGLILHSIDFRKRYTDLVSPEIRTVIIVGGNKSAVEAASACALAGKTVHWLIRPNGAGPTVLANPRSLNGMSAFKPVVCRWAQFNNPTIYRERGWWDWFFSSGENRVGSWVREWFWGFMTKRAIGDRYEKSEGGKVLKPDVCSIFWTASGLSVVHDDENKLFDIIDQGELVKPARLSIVSVRDKKFTLSDDSTIEADALFWATGWLPSSNPLLSPELQAELGFPQPLSTLLPSETAYWHHLDTTADKKILSLYPMLATPPPNLPSRPQTETQRRQLRTIIPTSLASRNDRSLILLGQLVNTQHFYFAETSALWGIAYLENLHVEDKYTGRKKEMDEEVALHNAFMRWRYPGRRNEAFAVLEIRDWMDVMLRDLGVRSDRYRWGWEKRCKEGRKGKGWGWGGWVEEWFTPYVPGAYEGIVGELLERDGREREEGKRVCV